MPSRDLVQEAVRLATICGACRYCESFCPVFPAIERRREFAEADTVYLANLCHECRTCYYACPYAPPHEFGVNLPETLTRLRFETYQEYTLPRVAGRLFRRSGATAALIVATMIAAILVVGAALEGTGAWWIPRSGEGAFYAVLPFTGMVFVASAMLVYSLAVLAAGTVRFWRATSAGPRSRVDWGALARATADAFGLRHMRGGGPGCTYPDERPSTQRRILHQLVAYGFGLDLASTSVAAFYHHVLHVQAPYPLWSVPVVLGTAGGLMLVVGTTGLLALRARSDERPASEDMLALNASFLALLLATSLSGLLLMALRERAIMGLLLAVHLGLVAGLFLTLPYGKFAHVAYRYAALIRNATEQAGRAASES